MHVLVSIFRINKMFYGLCIPPPPNLTHTTYIIYIYIHLYIYLLKGWGARYVQTHYTLSLIPNFRRPWFLVLAKNMSREWQTDTHPNSGKPIYHPLSNNNKVLSIPFSIIDDFGKHKTYGNINMINNTAGMNRWPFLPTCTGVSNE